MNSNIRFTITSTIFIINYNFAVVIDNYTMQARLKPVIKDIDQSILVKNDKLKTFYAPHHYHPDYEIIYIKKSCGIRIVGNNIDNYQAGEVIILGPGLPHYHLVSNVTEEDEDTPIETIAVLFPESIITSNIVFQEFAHIKSILEPANFGIELTRHTRKGVQELLKDMTVSPSFNNFILLFKILGIIAKKNSSYRLLSTVKYQNKKIYNQKTKLALKYLSDHYLENLKIKDIALHIGLSKTGFCNFFKAQTGFTFTNYLNALRISKACELLMITDKNITEIAFEIGYENLAYFNRRFKDIKGTTPRAFRAKLGRDKAKNN